MPKKQTAAQALLPKEPLAARIKKDLRNNYLLYLLIVPGILLLVLFKIGPVGAMVIAFEDYSPALGVFGSKFVGFDQFIRIFQDPYIWKITGNTIILAFLSVVVVFPIPIIFALFLNEIKVKWIRSTVQSLSFLPYFISAAVMVSILYTLLSPSSGLVNAIIVCCRPARAWSTPSSSSSGASRPTSWPSRSGSARCTSCWRSGRPSAILPSSTSPP